MARKTYRVNADSIGVLVDLLVGTPEDFNGDRDRLRGYAEKHPMAGRLNGGDYDVLMANRKQGRITYVIYSYNTPIAWRIWDHALFGGKPAPSWEQHWVMPQHPPMTNSSAKHVAKVRTALSQISGGI
jgi:hypothetical protein